MVRAHDERGIDHGRALLDPLIARKAARENFGDGHGTLRPKHLPPGPQQPHRACAKANQARGIRRRRSALEIRFPGQGRRHHRGGQRHQARSGQALAPLRGSLDVVQYLPEVPTFAEAGPPSMSQMMANAWYAVVAPPNTPREVVEKYERAINEVLSSPAIQKKFEEMGIDPLVATSAEAGRFMRQEAEKWGRVIRASKITLD
jgi:Uncharacterized protein conserved in bacteria